MSLLFTPDTGTTSKPQVKDLGIFDEIVTIEEVQAWVQQFDVDEKETLDSLRIAAIRMLERNYNITLSKRTRTAYYFNYGRIVSLSFRPHESIDEVRVNGEIITDFEEQGFDAKLLIFPCDGLHLEVDFTGGKDTGNDDLKRAVLMQVKFMYDGEWDKEEVISPEVDKFLTSYATIY